MHRWLLVAVAVLALGGASIAEAPCTVEVLFVRPGVDEGGGAIQEAILAELEAAVASIDIAIFSFTYTDPALLHALVDAHREGITVRVIFDKVQSGQDRSAIHPLAAAGIDVARHIGGQYFHHKFVIIDGARVITGSYNWSDNANRRNWENVVLIECPHVADAYTVEFNQLWIWFSEEACVDINTASLDTLQRISHIGPARAQQIITLREERPFCCLDDLARVDGLVLGGARLEQIKAEGRACVEPATSGVSYPCRHGWRGE